MSDMTTGISISWISSHRRSREIAHVVGVQPYFVRGASRLLPVRYLRQHLETRRLLKSHRPNVVVVMQPPPLALIAIAGYARRHGTLVIGDLHSGVFMDKKWAWASPWVLGVLRRRGGAVVPNADLAAICRKAGVQTFVSHGWITPLEDKGQQLPPALSGGNPPFVLIPFTYASDEPVDEVLAAAERVPSVTWVLTGRPPEAVVEKAPANVAFPGFVSDEEFQALLLNARAVLALTTRKSTMQSAGYEAVASATPLVTVNEPVLRDYFGEAAVYTGLEAMNIAASVQHVLSNQDSRREAMRALQSEVVRTQGSTADAIRAWVRGNR
jgi:glycosyltransferase involved in cell wall biosynthesis